MPAVACDSLSIHSVVSGLLR